LSPETLSLADVRFLAAASSVVFFAPLLLRRAAARSSAMSSPDCEPSSFASLRPTAPQPASASVLAELAASVAVGGVRSAARAEPSTVVSSVAPRHALALESVLARLAA
jgi:hypothetical protein